MNISKLRELAQGPFWIKRARQECADVSNKVFHKWAQYPDYEKLDEDMAVSLVMLYRDAMVEQMQFQHSRSAKLTELLIEIIERQDRAIRFALIYDPQIDTYKVKHTAYPKLKAALSDVAALVEAGLK